MGALPGPGSGRRGAGSVLETPQLRHTMDVPRFRRLLLGLVVGASFGLVVGALVASWVLGRAAGSADLGPGIAISLVGVAAGSVGGAVIGWRAGGSPPSGE